MVNLSGWAINELPKWIVFVSHLPDIRTLFAGGGTSERGSGHVELASFALTSLPGAMDGHQHCTVHLPVQPLSIN